MRDEALGPQASPVVADEWACVEIFGHRRHYGRIAEIERFGTKMLRVDVPTGPAAPLLATMTGEADAFETFFYGGASIFSVTPMTEAAARAYAERARPKPFNPRSALPPPDDDDREFSEIDEEGEP